MNLLDYAIELCISLPTYDIEGSKINWTKKQYEDHFKKYNERFKNRKK